jgi:Flp pilus assembly protein TadD
MPGLRLNLALSLFKSGAMSEAVHMLTPLLMEKPLSAAQQRQLDILIGMSHFGLGEYAAAIPYLREATTHDAES